MCLNSLQVSLSILQFFFQDLSKMDNERATEQIRKASIVLKKAVDYDKLKKFNDAIPKYTEGIVLLSAALR